MRKDIAVEIDRTDLTTLLGCLASDLRNAGQAVRAITAEHASEGAQDLADADRLAGSLDRVGSTLDALRDHLCQTCQFIAISEQIRLEIPSRRGPK